MTKYKQNEDVCYTLSGTTGRGKVVGLATVNLPVLGPTYIVEDTSGNFPSEEYPFTHIVCPEMWLSK